MVDAAGTYLLEVLRNERCGGEGDGRGFQVGPQPRGGERVGDEAVIRWRQRLQVKMRRPARKGSRAIRLDPDKLHPFRKHDAVATLNLMGEQE